MARTTDLSPPPAPAEEQGPARAAHSPAFPGCRSFRLTRDGYKTYHGRVEYWDAATETARPTSGAASSTSTPSGAFPRCGWRCPTSGRRRARRDGRPG